MTEELRMLDSEFDEIFTVIKKGMDRLEKEKGDAKMKKWVELDGKLKQCNDLLKSYRLEIYELEKSDRVLFDKNAERYEQTISKLQSDLMFRRPKSDREELFQGVQQGGRDIETMTADEILDEAGKVQDTDLKIIRDASNLLTTETVPIAERTLGLLQEQTQDLERIAVDLSTVHDNLTRANNSLKKFGQRIQSDKVVWVLILLIVGAIIFVIVWSATRGSLVPTPSPTPSP